MPYTDPINARRQHARWMREHPEYSKEQWEKHKEKYNARRRTREGDERESYNTYMRKVNKECWRKIRDETLSLLGCKCAKCGFTDRRALQIDHVNGGGGQEMSKSKSSISYYRAVLRKVREGSVEYQILCANCNWIKRDEDKLP